MASDFFDIAEFPDGADSIARAAAFFMRDVRFYALIAEIVESHPSDWNDIEIFTSALNLKRKRLLELQRLSKNVA